MLEFILGILVLILIHVAMWGLYELFFWGYWKFICFGIEHELINEDIFGKIEEMKKIPFMGV